MPISVTCQCGARLEIDEKFLGKEVLCPDCQRPLPTTAPATPPPIELPEHRRTSGLAVLSLVLSLVFAFVGGGLAGIAVGVLALKEIAHSKKLDGVNFARAGIAVGIVGTLLFFAVLISPSVGGLDVFLRDLAMAGRLNYAGADVIEFSPNQMSFEITRPTRAWARFNGQTVSNNTKGDDLILVNTVEDAYIACQRIHVDFDDDLDAKQNKALDRFNQSQLVDLIGRLGGAAHEDARIIETSEPEAGVKEILVDIRLAGVERRAILRFRTNEAIPNIMLVGCARRGRFDSVEAQFRQAFASFKNKL